MDFNFDQWMSFSELNPGELDRRQQRVTKENLSCAPSQVSTTLTELKRYAEPVDPQMSVVIDLLASRIATLDAILKQTLPTIMQTTK